MMRDALWLILFPFRWLVRDTKRRLAEIWKDCWHDATPERSKAGLWQVLSIVLTILVSTGLSRWWFPSKPDRLAPPEVRERVAECILTGDRDACAFYESIKASWPVQPH